MKFRTYAILLLSVLALIRVAGGQMTTGSILGTVHDSTGAVIAGATITVTDTNKGTSKSDVSDANGNYSIPFLIPGTYNITVKAPGFKTDVSRNIVVDIDQKARADFNLQPGGVTETVNVDAAPPLNSSASNASSSWPNRIGRRGKIDHGTPQHFFDTSLCSTGQTTLASGAPCAFQIPTKYTYGNSARSVLYGPTTKDWDIGLQKAFSVYRERRLAFRLDAFNTFNTPNFATPNAALGSPTAGQITGTVNDNRDMQGSITLYF